MAATITPSTRLLIKALQTDYPSIKFKKSYTSAWNPVESTVLYEPTISAAQLLHELSHAVLSHTSYRFDIELLRMERDAWHKATELADTYNISINQDDIDTHLDTYREWLHARSTCPSCNANGVQADTRRFRCLECRATWQVNEARTCSLRRYLN